MAETYHVWSDDVDFAERGDAEYWLPAYRQVEDTLETLCSRPLGSLAHVSDGNHIAISEYFVSKGRRYLRGKDLSEFFIDDSDPVYVSEAIFSELKRSHVKPLDVLTSIVGTIGNIALVPPDSQTITANCKIGILRCHSINPFYLAIFLTSGLGRTQIERKIRGAVQRGILLGDLANLRVFVPSENDQHRVERSVMQAYQLHKQALIHYREAETILESELKLLEVNLAEDMAFWTWDDRIDVIRRVDAPYYQPRYERARQALRASGFPVKRLSEVAEIVCQKFNERTGLDRKVRYVEIGDINCYAGEIRSHTEEHLSRLPTNPKIQTHAGDVLYSKVRPYRKGIALVPNELDGSLVTSGFAVVRPGAEIAAEYLLTYLRSELGLMGAIKEMSGATYPTINEEVVSALPVPIVSSEIQARIAKLVKQSYRERLSSRMSLDQATQYVENLVGNA